MTIQNAFEGLQLIVGLGATGVSCLRFLKQRDCQIGIMDTRANPPFQEALAELQFKGPTHFGGFDEALLKRASQIILSPGLSLNEPAILNAVKYGQRVIGDIELFAASTQKPIVAITGTNAKSTVTTLVGEMASACGRKVAVGGNLGTPALDLLLDMPDADLFVLELSSFQLETTYQLPAKVSTILNISPDHMDRYKKFEHYCAAKHRIYHQCEVAVCNADDPLTECRKSGSDKFYFTLKAPKKNTFGLIEQDDQIYLAFENQALMSTRSLPVAGKHYQANALAALAIGHALNFSLESMLQVLKRFPGLPHRCQFVREIRQVRWYNDSKGTNVGATEAAIKGLGAEIKGKLILLAGGVGKNADFKPLVPLLKDYVRHVVLYGQAAEAIAEVIGDHPHTFAKDLRDAVWKARQLALPNDSVLLSPACASFDMFKDYQHRGDVFMNLVNQLAK